MVFVLVFDLGDHPREVFLAETDDSVADLPLQDFVVRVRLLIDVMRCAAFELAAYTLNVPFMLRDRVDFGVIIKQFANSQKGGRYSPAKRIGTKKKTRFGNPDEALISTSHVSRPATSSGSTSRFA